MAKCWRVKSEAGIEAAARTQVHEGDPGVLLVPNDWRNRARDEDREENIQSGPLEFVPESRGEGQHEEDGN